MREFIQSDATKFIILLAVLLANAKNGRFLLVKSDRSTFQIFCSRSLRQYRINYKFHVSVSVCPLIDNKN